MSPVRRLTAILAADVAGYSRLMGEDEEGTHERLKEHLEELVNPKIAEHRGRVVKNTGDGFLAEFASVVDAVRSAAEIQGGMADRDVEMQEERRIRFRIGINLGDVIAEEHDIFGDGVNVAARLEGLAEPGGICVSRVVRDQVRDKLDYAFEDLGEQQVKNIARPVRAYRVRDPGAPAEKPSPASPQPLPLPDKPSIAVLPFANMSGDPEQEYFADGMVEEITTALSRIRWLFVIARNSSFTYKGPAIDVKRVGRELGVRYVLEGSVRKGGNRVRITGQLIEAETGAHLWAGRFDGSLEDVFELQDRVALGVSSVIEPTLEAAEIRRALSRRTTDLTAYDLYLRALDLVLSRTKDEVVRALDLLRWAIECDPTYGPALALAATGHVYFHASGWTDNPDANCRQGLDLARRALRFADEDPGVLARSAYALGYFDEDIEPAIALIERALELNPGCAPAWPIGGWLRLWAGQPDRAIHDFQAYQRLRGPRATEPPGIGVAYLFSRRFEEARKSLLLSLQDFPSWVPTYRFLACCYAHMDRLGEAREIVERLQALTPVVVPSATNWRNPADRELLLSGLRLAAGDDT